MRIGIALLLLTSAYRIGSSQAWEGPQVAATETAAVRWESIREDFHENGYTVLRGFFTNDDDDDASSSTTTSSLLREEWPAFAARYWDRIFRVLHERGHISQPQHAMTPEYTTGKLRQPGYKEIVHRHPGRYELALNYDQNQKPSQQQEDCSDQEESSAPSDPGQQILYHDMPPLQPIIDQLEPIILSILRRHPDYRADGPVRYNLLQSMLISAPGSESQKFHIDTKHINDDEHLPAHIINVFIPLIDIPNEDLGPTELVPQSHKQTRFLYNPAQRHRAGSFEPAVTPLLDVGDVLLFDFRTLHRGLANRVTTQRNRPMLVLAFSIPAFHDKANWPGPSIFA